MTGGNGVQYLKKDMSGIKDGNLMIKHEPQEPQELCEQKLEENVPGTEIYSISSIVEGNLDLEAVGGHRIPYKGYCTLALVIGGYEVMVPFLVTKEKLCQPIIGFNTISAIVKDPDFDRLKGIPDLAQSFPKLSEQDI